MQDVIQQFITEVIKKAAIDKMPEDFKKEYTEKLGAEAQRRLGIMAMGELNEQGVKDFEEFMANNKSPKPEKVLEFFGARIPDFTAKVTEALKKFAEEFIAGAERLKGTKLTQ